MKHTCKSLHHLFAQISHVGGFFFHIDSIHFQFLANAHFCLQVNGKLYVVDEKTLLLKDFTYDGQGRDAFFFGGGDSSPNPSGMVNNTILLAKSYEAIMPTSG